MRRASSIPVLLLIPLRLSLTSITTIHAVTIRSVDHASDFGALPPEINSGRMSLSSAYYSAEPELNGDEVYDIVVTVNWVGPLSGTTVSEERDIVYPNGTVAELGTGTFTGSVDGRSPGSMIDNYTGSFVEQSAMNLLQNATLNDTVTFTDGNYGLTGLQVQLTDQAHLTSCSTQQILAGQQTTCIGSGTYALSAANDNHFDPGIAA
jgi:hypothetical protein